MEDKYWLWFMALDITAKRKLELLEKYISIEKIYYDYSFDNSFDLKVNLELLNEDKKDITDIMYKYIRKNNIKIIKYIDEVYPESLKQIYDPPIALLAIGNESLLKRRKIAIVGARDCSDYGKEITANISKILSYKDYVIVSGLAKGIDREAHVNSNKDNTIAVIGSGITKSSFYPKENYNLFLDIVKKGGLVLTEFMPNEEPKKWYFPMRNRIISGISEAVIVTEAKKRSGSLITARYALEEGKNVYTIPGNICDGKYDGNNLLIRDGAIPIVSIDDIVEYF